MFLYNSTSQNKGMKTPKIAPELIQHFKNTAEIPKKSFKQNQNPKQLSNVHPDIKIENKNDNGVKIGAIDKSIKMTKSKIVEDDISKIANSYILEGNFLKKHQAYQDAINKEKNKTVNVNKQNLQQPKSYDRKQLLKLEYLQKMGFLRPDQKQVLAQFRKMNNIQTKQTSTNARQQQQRNMNSAVPMRTHSKPLQNTQMHDYLPYYSPKGMDLKKLSQLSHSHFINPNSKLMYPGHMGNY